MSPDEFIAKWRGVALTERAAAQEHFIDLCRLLDEPTPVEADPTGTWYAFEKGAKKAGGGDGWADIWKRQRFGWEYKRPGGNLDEAFKQLQIYTPSLEYPPLLIVSDIQTIRIHTAFTGLVPVVHVLTLDDLRNPAQRRLLKWAFTEPERLRPGQTTAALTEQAAGRLGDLAQVWRSRGHDPLRVAHFSQQVLFCLFAEDIALLPGQLFAKLLQAGLRSPADARTMLESLFGAMATGGLVGFEPVDWFNGGLFAAGDALPLEKDDLQQLLSLAALDWSAIEPSIFGTLFERGLDPTKRAQLGAHYTDRASILRLVDPVVLEPLRAEWAAARERLAALIAKAKDAQAPAARTKALGQAQALLQAFLERLRRFRVLDPACGSGNFLLLALLGLKDLEHQALLDAEALGLPRGFPMVGPENVLGIELNPYAAELARVTIWIGEIQWMLSHGFSLAKNPILKALDNIQQRDAIVNEDGSEPEWPEADAIVGNPPFLGDKKMIGALGEEYVTRLRKLYQGRVPGGADLVIYWFERARAQIASGRTQRAGLVATNSIRQKRNRPILERIRETGAIFHAWADEPWINDGAAVRVSLVGFGTAAGQPIMLDGRPAAAIHTDLTGTRTGSDAVDLTQARPLLENAGCSFFGLCLAGAFAVDSATARGWLRQSNPHGRPNSDVLRPIWNGVDITQGWKGRWVIDFGTNLGEAEAALYEAPFAQVLAKVKPVRMSNREKSRVDFWWRHGRPRPELRRKLAGLTRYLATPETAKHRFFVWLPISVAPEHKLVVIPRDDDEIFGILSARFHVLWAVATGGRLGVGNDPVYNSTRCFETFPFPEGLTPNLPASAYVDDPRAQAIADAARRLNELRENWLNPPQWVERVPEVVPGYPDRIIPKPEHAAELKKRTLTHLYNQRPTWLDHAHRALDVAVAAAYGWADYGPEMPDDEILSRLLVLNLERSTGDVSPGGRGGANPSATLT